MRKLIWVFCFTVVSHFSHAGSATGVFNVKEVRIENGVTYIYPKNAITNGEQCAAAVPIALNPNTAGFEQIFSMVLAAAASGKGMQCWASGCVSSPWGSTRPNVFACGFLAD